MSNQTSRTVKTVGTLTIPNGAQASNILLAESFAHFEEIGIYAPVTLTETVQLQVSGFDKAVASYGDTDFRIAESPPGTPVAVNADKQTTIGRMAAYALRMKSTTNVAADRVFTLVGRVPFRY